jgi:hypothetical protein
MEEFQRQQRERRKEREREQAEAKRKAEEKKAREEKERYKRYANEYWHLVAIFIAFSHYTYYLYYAPRGGLDYDRAELEIERGLFLEVDDHIARPLAEI